jgi:hypothetical protein
MPQRRAGEGAFPEFSLERVHNLTHTKQKDVIILNYRLRKITGIQNTVEHGCSHLILPFRPRRLPFHLRLPTSVSLTLEQRKIDMPLRHVALLKTLKDVLLQRPKKKKR